MSDSENQTALAAALAAEWAAWIAKCNRGGTVTRTILDATMNLTTDTATLQERVRRFNLGTPTALHVGTHELVNDLWRELEISRQPADANPSRSVRQHSGDRSAHTPGPLVARRINGDAKPFAVINPNGPGGDDIVAGYLNEADANLYAAAPDMLAALKECADDLVTHGGGDGLKECFGQALDERGYQCPQWADDFVWAIDTRAVNPKAVGAREALTILDAITTAPQAVP